MKKNLSRAIVCTVIAAMLLCLCPTSAFAASYEGDKLTFNEDGTFKILYFCDMQDDCSQYSLVKRYIKDLVASEEPDLIALGGDNISGGSSATKLLGKTAIDQYMSIFDSLGVPVVAVFGNHDGEGALSKDEMWEIYQSYDCFIGYDAEPEMYGCGTSNYPIYDESGENILFNIYAVDSNMYNSDESIGGYDYVHEDQVEWYRGVREALKAETGAYVPSFAFQHIIVPQIFDALIEVTEEGENTISYNGKLYKLPEGAGTMHEKPCPPDTSVEKGYYEFDAMKEKGDVLAMFFGHDHVNDFCVNYEGVDLVATPGTGFSSYGDDTRGAQVITLNTDDLTTYDSHVAHYLDFYADDQAALSAFVAFGSENNFLDRVAAFFSYLWYSFIGIFEA